MSADVKAVSVVRFWASWLPDLTEVLAHPVGVIMRRFGGEASVEF